MAYDGSIQRVLQGVELKILKKYPIFFKTKIDDKTVRQKMPVNISYKIYRRREKFKNEG